MAERSKVIRLGRILSWRGFESHWRHFLSSWVGQSFLSSWVGKSEEHTVQLLQNLHERS